MFPFPVVWPKIGDVFYGALEEMFLLERSVKEILDEVKPKIDEILRSA